MFAIGLAVRATAVSAPTSTATLTELLQWVVEVNGHHHHEVDGGEAGY
jgi:hypothetical protein